MLHFIQWDMQSWGWREFICTFSWDKHDTLIHTTVVHTQLILKKLKSILKIQNKKMHEYSAPTEMFLPFYCLCHWNIVQLKLLCFERSLQKVFKCLVRHTCTNRTHASVSGLVSLTGLLSVDQKWSLFLEHADQ